MLPLLWVIPSAERLLRAFFSSHVQAGVASDIFSSPFSCLTCRNRQGEDGKQDVVIDGCSAWDAHVSVAHGEVARIWTVENRSTGRKRKRMAESEEVATAASKGSSVITAQDVAPTDDIDTEVLAPSDDFDIRLVDPLLLGHDRKRMKRPWAGRRS